MLPADGLGLFRLDLFLFPLLLAKVLLIFLGALVLVLVVGMGVALAESAYGHRQAESEQQRAGEDLFHELTEVGRWFGWMVHHEELWRRIRAG